MNERYFDNQRFKKIRFVEIALVSSLLFSGFILVISEEGSTIVTPTMFLGVILSMIGFGYILPSATEWFYIRKTGKKI